MDMAKQVGMLQECYGTWYRNTEETMSGKEKFTGIFPALYACYDDRGEVSSERVRLLTRHLVDKGVQGLYVGGSSGECIYQGVTERQQVLEAVMAEARDEIVVIAHVACNNTRDSQELAAHAEQHGVDAIAAIPPIYFHLPNTPSPLIGMTFRLPHPIRISSCTTFRSSQELRCPCRF
jgi:hypothetical protein